MKVKRVKKKITDEEYYDKRGILGEIIEEDVAISFDEAFRQGGIGVRSEGEKLRFLNRRYEVEECDDC